MSSRSTRPGPKVPPKTAAKPGTRTPRTPTATTAKTPTAATTRTTTTTTTTAKTPTKKETMKKAEDPKVEETKASLEKAQEARQELKKNVNDLKGELESMQAEYEERLKQTEREGKEQNDQRIARAREEINQTLERSRENNWAAMQDRYRESAQKVDHQKNDILRMNKIFRDVSRCLGTNWRSVYEVLTLSWPPQVTDMHLAKIEAQRPFMQAYKALMSWKELAGDKFDIMTLVDALRQCNLHELAAATQETMHTEGDSLISLGNVGSGIASGVERQTSFDGEGGAQNGGQRASAQSGGSDMEGPLGNKRLLQLSRLVGGSYADLGRELMVPKEELEEVLQNEGMTYQGAFKILWGWRDRNEDSMHQDNVEVLKTALTKTGRQELIEQIGL